MKDSRVAIGAIVLAAVVALMTPLTGQAARGGGGGHFGGGGGGTHFGGGGRHFGGGGMLSHLGGVRLGSGRIGGVRTRAGGVRLGRISSGSRRRVRTGFAGRELQTGRAHRHGLSRGRRMVATRVARGFSRRDFAGAAFGA